MRYDEPGTYEVNLTATDDCGNTATATREIVVEEEPSEYPYILFTANDSPLNIREYDPTPINETLEHEVPQGRVWAKVSIANASLANCSESWEHYCGEIGDIESAEFILEDGMGEAYFASLPFYLQNVDAPLLGNWVWQNESDGSGTFSYDTLVCEVLGEA